MMEKKHLHLLREEDYYQGLRRRVQEWGRDRKGSKAAEWVLLAPDFFHLLVKLSMDGEVKLKNKAKLVGAISYFIFPLDALAEAVIGPVGMLDDVAVAAWVLNDLIRAAGPDVVRKHWAGDGDVFETVARVIAAADDVLGAGLVKRLKMVIKNFGAYSPLGRPRVAELRREG